MFQGKVIGGIIEKAGGVVLKGIGMVAGNKEKQQEQDTTRYASTVDLQKAELAATSDNWFDRIINAYARLPRPVILTGACYYVFWVAQNSTGPLDFANNLSATPVWFTFIVSTIILYPFGSRPLEKHFTTRYMHARQDKLADREAKQNSDNTATTQKNSSADVTNPALDRINDIMNRARKEEK